MFLIIGLGNPGTKYEGTRHNVGFVVLDTLAQRCRAGAWKLDNNALCARAVIANQDVLLAKPQTFMNLSGDAAGALCRYYKIPPENVVAVHDELDFDVGDVRVKFGGGHGGNNGIRSLVAHVGGDFSRVRVGIGKPATKELGANYVLSHFDKREQTVVNEAVLRAAEAVELVVLKGPHAAMNEVNRRVAVKSD